MPTTNPEAKEQKTVRIDENGVKRRNDKKEDENEKMIQVLNVLRSIVSVGDPDKKYINRDSQKTYFCTHCNGRCAS